MRSLARSSLAASRRSLGGRGALLVISLLLGWTGPAFAQSTQENTGANFTILDFPGAGDTTANGINNEETFETFDVPGSTGTIVFDISVKREMAGNYTDKTNRQHGFFRDADGVLTTLDPPGSTFTEANRVTVHSVVGGSYIDSKKVNHGYIWSDGEYTVLDAPGSTGTIERGMNPRGDIVGLYFTADGHKHGFLLSEGAWTFFDRPGASDTVPTAITPGGVIVGSCFMPGMTKSEGFIWDQNGFNTIAYPGAVETSVNSINPEGVIVGRWDDTQKVRHAFTLADGVYTSYDAPGAVGLTAFAGINPQGDRTDNYTTADKHRHGMILWGPSDDARPGQGEGTDCDHSMHGDDEAEVEPRG
jgi:hypothetical protein